MNTTNLYLILQIQKVKGLFKIDVSRERGSVILVTWKVMVPIETSLFYIAAVEKNWIVVGRFQKFMDLSQREPTEPKISRRPNNMESSTIAVYRRRTNRLDD